MDVEYEITELKKQLNFYKKVDLFIWLVVVSVVFSVIIYFGKTAKADRLKFEKNFIINKERIDSLNETEKNKSKLNDANGEVFNRENCR